MSILQSRQVRGAHMPETARPLSSLVVAAAVGLSLIGLGGCSHPSSSGSPTLSATWRQQFDSALADPHLSDFQRSVLSDYDVTDAEYLEAQNRYVACMSDRG